MRQLQTLLLSSCLICIRLYRLLVSPLLPVACRFEPTCSQYAAGALRSHGVIKGGWLVVHRLLRCHPFGRHGYDPVPVPHSCGITPHTPCHTHG